MQGLNCKKKEALSFQLVNLDINLALQLKNKKGIKTENKAQIN